MKNLKIKEIIEITKGQLIQGNEEQICQNFSKDTRTLKKGDTYLAIKGENFDGNQFWKQALDQGASTVIVSNIEISQEELKNYSDKNIIKVEDTLEALYKIAAKKREKYQIPVIAITGSVGKTSTKDIVANVVAQKYKTLKTEGNNNNNIGLPFTILKLQDEEALVLEMGMNHLGEISLLSNIAKPDICIITNIGTSHIGNLGSRENILKAKLEILEGAKNPKIILNNDNDLLHNWCQNNPNNNNIYTYGIKEPSNIQAKKIEQNQNQSKFICQLDEKEAKITVPVGGNHFILNALCAVTVGKILNIEARKIVKGIEEFKLTKKRMEIISILDEIKIINDAYNASLESMKASLTYLAQFKNNRKIAILGDMLELGKYTKKLHKEVGKAVYQNQIDILITSGKNAKAIAEQARQEGMKEEAVIDCQNQEEIVKKLKQIVKKQDIILIKASNGMKFYELPDKIEKAIQIKG